MAKITNFLFCEDDDNFKNKTELFSTIEMVEVDKDNFTLNIVLTICDYLTSEEHFCELKIKDPQNNIVFQTGNLTIPDETPAGFTPANTFIGFTLGVSFNELPYKGSGIYSVEVFFDDEVLNAFYIPVILTQGGK